MIVKIVLLSIKSGDLKRIKRLRLWIEAIGSLRKRAGDSFQRPFKKIPSYNGSEFAGLYTALQDTLDVNFTHHYTSWYRGTSENQHKFISHFLPKVQPLKSRSHSELDEGLSA